jgi:hypothetical protein
MIIAEKSHADRTGALTEAAERPVHPEQVGTPDPERRNSPVLTDPEQSFELLREQVGDEAEGCYFNDVLYGEGATVRSGNTPLRCERGIWVEAEPPAR